MNGDEDMADQRILIVEDSPTMRQLLVFALKRMKGVEIVETTLHVGYGTFAHVH